MERQRKMTEAQDRAGRKRTVCRRRIGEKQRDGRGNRKGKSGKRMREVGRRSS